MRAVVIHAARDLRVEEYEAETAGPGEVAVAVEAGGICGSDLHYYPARGLRCGAPARADDPRPRGGGTDRGAG